MDKQTGSDSSTDEPQVLKQGFYVDGERVVAAFGYSVASQRYEVYVLSNGRRFITVDDGPFQELARVPGTEDVEVKMVRLHSDDAKDIERALDAAESVAAPIAEPVNEPTGTTTVVSHEPPAEKESTTTPTEGTPAEVTS